MSATSRITADQISALVETTVTSLPLVLQEWATEHFVRPRIVTASHDSEGTDPATLWLVTDDNGHGDACCRIVFDDQNGQFGLVWRLANGVDQYLGPFGSFADAVLNIRAFYP